VRDDELRELERRASQGDAEARRALENAWARLGRGWNGETLPDRLRTGFEKPFYLWDTRLGFAIEMVLVPAGEVEVAVLDLHLSGRLGSAYEVTRREKRSVARPFWIARAQVSRDQFAQHRYVGTPLPDDPVVTVTHERAAEFAAYVGLDLPTEAQWDKAACETLRGRSLLTGTTPEWCVDDYVEPAAPSISGKVLRRVVGASHARDCGDARVHAAIRLVLADGRS
jgi:formylglycine-generating enzyme required for sulfatase activity